MSINDNRKAHEMAHARQQADDLPLFARRPDDTPPQPRPVPVAGVADADRIRQAGQAMAARMLLHLAGGEWITRAAFQALFDLKDHRQLSLGAEHSDCRIISGPKGFKAADLATQDDWRECLRRMEAQIETEQRRRIKHLQAYHATAAKRGWETHTEGAE